MPHQFNSVNESLRRRPRTFAPLDALVILFIIVAAGITLPVGSKPAPAKVVIFRDNRVVADYSIDCNRTVRVNGAVGPMEIVIKNRRVFVARSSCPHGICMKSGPIERPHRQIVCAPNHIMVTITSSEDDSIDAIAR